MQTVRDDDSIIMGANIDRRDILGVVCIIGVYLHYVFTFIL
jgi:hypothetical protein